MSKAITAAWGVGGENSFTALMPPSQFADGVYDGMKEVRVQRNNPEKSRFRPRRPERGAALVEFTLVLMPMMALLMLTIDAAWGIFAKASLQEAAREGVRFGVTCQVLSGQSGLDASIKQVVEQYSFGFVNANNVNSTNPKTVDIHYYAQQTSGTTTTIVDVTGQSGSTAGGNIIQVTVNGVAIRAFAPIWRSSTPLSLGAISADSMEGSPNGIPCKE